MKFNIFDGGAGILTIILCMLVITVGAIGFTYFVLKWDQRVAGVQNDTVNLTGITTTGETYNATNGTVHQIAGILPNLVWVVLIFIILAILTIVAVGFKR